MSASKSASASVETLSTLERLILAQAVYEFGSNKWDKVATILSKHPLLHRPRNFYAPETCDRLFTALMSDAALSLPDPENSRRAPTVLGLAQIHYVARVNEIKQLLSEEETRFKELVEEIDLIRSGKWDDKIHADLLGVPLTTPTPPAVTQLTEEIHTTPPPVPTPGAAELLEDSAHIVEQMLVANESLSTTSPPEEQLQAPVITESQPSEPVPLQSKQSTPDEVEEGLSEAQPASASPAAAPPTAAPTRTPSPKPIEVIEEREVEEVAERPAEEEDTQMEVDAEEARVDAEKEERSSSPQRAKTTPASAEQDMEMERTPPGVPQPHEGKRKSSEALSEPLRERKRLREESEPVDEEEPGPSTMKGRRKAQVGDKKFQNVIGMLHSTISQHRYGNIFHNPIKKSEAPDYSDLVKRPMDLKTIKARVKEGLITNSLEFQRDVYLMFANAMMYNRPGSEIYAMAEEMMLESELQINNFRQTEGFHHK